MRQCIALASLACLFAAGCANSGFLGNRGGEASHVAVSRNAPRPGVFRSPGAPCCELCSFNSKGGCDADCGCSVGGCCEDDCCGDECCGNGKGRKGKGLFSGGLFGSRSGGKACGNDPCNCNPGMCGVVGGLASGFCPHGGGYPEYPTYNPGPPTGQVAYPYYTVRGPRDFLMSNPPSIGPY